jgi:7 transmembrane receptor (rhodopsin family)
MYCYGRILAVVRRQAMVSNAGSGGTNTALNSSSQRAQMSVIKTMLIVTVLFVVCWLPNTIYYLLTVVIFLWDLQIYYVTIFFAFLNICLNPFVYAGQHDLVRMRLHNLLHAANQSSGAADGNVAGTCQQSMSGSARVKVPVVYDRKTVSWPFKVIRSCQQNVTANLRMITK